MTIRFDEPCPNNPFTLHRVVGTAGYPRAETIRCPPCVPVSAVVRQRLVRHLEACRYWQGISECECNSSLPIGGCLRCDMDKAVELLTEVIEANTDLSGGEAVRSK